ncbi:LysR family transcriptional regulator [Paraferrimonas sedimenticola]|uniref:LysR family transcriptional regulator n=1 Tax=Paraferrimonas sedimenticola TaxID=375674 RepID=A0AA37RX75_9GAMM|nr:LysR family transcriptional regulator [Paraferrimonas sedimenticola]GLP97101.1 LysR family transcriptional regulator [Paraferrimonas sedimenticola]
MHITTERLQYLVAVAKHGSFSSAARELGVSNTAVNKTIQALEFDLDLVIFERQAGKRPVLTDAGKALYFQALDILPRIIQMEQSADLLSQGVESSLSIALHPYTHYPEFNELLRELSLMYPTVELKVLDAEALSGYDDEFDVMIAPSRNTLPRGLQISTIGEFEWLIVCAPQFDLVKRKGHLAIEDFDLHQQLLLAEGFFTKPEYREAMRHSSRVISVDRFYQLRELLLSGVGFAMYPAKLAAPLIESGQLVDLEFDFGQSGNRWPIEVLWRNQQGKAGQWLVEQLVSD